MAERVELHQAFRWDCPECGRENFERAVTVEMSPEDREAFALQMQMEVSEVHQGDLVSAPEEVTCQHCGREFAATDDY